MSSRIRTIVVDDEPLPRRKIRMLLEDESDFEIVCECQNGEEAVEAIDSLDPQLVFLDIQMPGINGFEVLRRIATPMPLTVFVTAFDQYAVRAFEVRALDYLLKPVDRERFVETLERVRSTLRSGGAAAIRENLRGLLEEMQGAPRELDRIVVKSAGRTFFLSADEIDWVEAAGNYIRIHAGAEVHLMRGTMGSVEGELSGLRFMRVHRSAIVNPERIRELRPTPQGEHEILLRSGEAIPLSRKQRAALEERLGKPL